MIQVADDRTGSISAVWFGTGTLVPCRGAARRPEALRARFFGPGRKFTEVVARTTQLAGAGRAVQGGGATTR